VLALIVHGHASSAQTDQVNADGVVPGAPDLSGSTLAAGRRVRSGREITLDADFVARNHLRLGGPVRLATPVGARTFKLVGIERFGSGLQFGGQGFGSIPIAVARPLFSIPAGYSEIEVKVDPSVTVATVQRRIQSALPSNVEVSPPSQKSSAVDDQVRAFDSILDFFAAMAAFVGAFLILNAFNMTVAQRQKEIGVLRTLGAGRGQITRAVLIEALLLGLIGAPLGLLAGLGLAHLMAALVEAINFPIGTLILPPAAFVIAPAAGIGATLLGALRPALIAGRVPPIQAVLAEHAGRPPAGGRRAVTGVPLIAAGLVGVYRFAQATTTPLPVALEGVGGVVMLLGGVVLVAPLIVPELVKMLGVPIRLVMPIEGRIAADSARSNPLRTAATASGLMIGVALVAAIGTLGSSLISSISQQLDRQLKTDYTVQPLNYRQGGAAETESTIAPGVIGSVAALPGVRLATATRQLVIPAGFDHADYTALGYDPAVRAQVTTIPFTGETAARAYANVARGQVTVGGQLWRRTHVHAGQLITLKGPHADLHVRVAGVVSGSSLEDQAIGMSLATFRQLTGITADTQIQVLARSRQVRAQVGRELDRLVDAGYPDLDVLSNAGIKDQVESQTNQIFAIFYAIMLVAVIVSLLGVVNTMIISVLERTREIGVLRAIGSTRWLVRRVIADESTLLTVSGAVLGLAIGLALGYVYVRGVSSGLSGVSFRPPVAIVIAVAVASVAAGLGASILPARRAAAMNIIEAIGYE
jgi:putative ABC transport system permease protein